MALRRAARCAFSADASVTHGERLPARFGFDPGREAEWRGPAPAPRPGRGGRRTPRPRALVLFVLGNCVPPAGHLLLLGPPPRETFNHAFRDRRATRGR